MPPRYAYWTILIDNRPTAFRAREKEELLPTFQQLRRKNADIVLKWFARGRLWESRDAERDAWQRRKTPLRPERHGATAPARGDRTPQGKEEERRGREWRPGGQHKDPRDRFKRRKSPAHAWSKGDASAERDRKKLGPPRSPRPWRVGPPGQGQRAERPWRDPSKQDRPPERREAEPKPPSEPVPEPPSPPERIKTRPKPPERG